MSALATLIDRVEVLLMDTSNAIYSTALITESLRTVLHEYNRLLPLGIDALLVIPSSGREIALNTLENLRNVTAAWWPYDSTASAETWPPNEINGYRVYWDDGQPVLTLTTKTQNQPQADDEIRIWYTCPHTIENLDDADSTTFPADHETMIVTGAAGHAASMRAHDLIETANVDLAQVTAITKWADSQTARFRSWLGAQRTDQGAEQEAFPAGFKLDKWDTG